MLNLRNWQTPASAYPDKRLGCAQISSLQYNGVCECYGLRKHRYYHAHGITIKRLLIGRKTWMVDDPPHWWAMEEHATHYRGHVLCAGLGLGLIVHALHTNARVRQITVVERERDVIDLVSPFLPKMKLTIIHGDFWDYDGPTPDGVLYDLFVGDGRKLIGDALCCYLQLIQWFPNAVVRIHGFKNATFMKLGEVIKESNNLFRLT